MLASSSSETRAPESVRPGVVFSNLEEYIAHLNTLGYTKRVPITITIDDWGAPEPLLVGREEPNVASALTEAKPLASSSSETRAPESVRPGGVHSLHWKEEEPDAAGVRRHRITSRGVLIAARQAQGRIRRHYNIAAKLQKFYDLFLGR